MQEAYNRRYSDLLACFDTGSLVALLHAGLNIELQGLCIESSRCNISQMILFRIYILCLLQTNLFPKPASGFF